mgnify:CR=1 FL=1
MTMELIQLTNDPKAVVVVTVNSEEPIKHEILGQPSKQVVANPTRHSNRHGISWLLS